MGFFAALSLLLLLQVPRPAPFTTPYTPDQVRQKQAVVETSMGTFVVDLLPDAAPNHVGLFMKLAREGAYAGTIFHRVVRYGIIQGGDPISRDPAKGALYGTGGLHQLRSEVNAERHTAGAVSAVLVPNQPHSAGAQFFVCATDQPALDGQYTVFGRVSEGIEVVQAISAVDADEAGRPRARVVITAVTIRDTPPPKPVPFVNDTPEELARRRVVLDTSMGEIELELLADRAPETVRQFLRLADAGVYDGVLVHRIVSNFVIQTGAPAHRTAPLTPAQHALVRPLAPEFSNTPHVPGVVSMARGEDPASATTSFFICTGSCRSLDGQYTAFARVAAGMEVVLAMAGAAVDGETPREPIVVKAARIR